MNLSRRSQQGTFGTVEENAMGDWQPIETAPKDGERIDLWVTCQDGHGERITDAYWVTDGFSYVGERREGWYAPNRGYDGEDGWADDPEGSVTYYGKHVFTRATHWMHPPEPPSS